MELVQENKEGIITIKLDGWLDHTNSPKLQEVVDKINDAKSIVLDFLKIEYISSAGVRQIVSANKKAKELNASFSVINVNPDVMSVIAITGLDKKIDIKGI